MKLRWGLPVLLGAALIPVWVMAPPPDHVDAPDTVEGLIERCRRTGLSGRELADEAVLTVAETYPTHSLWHLAESPARSLRSHRGWSHQYNTVLSEVLRGLGFQTRLVHAARVRGFGHPWWLSGHSWVKVTIDGRERDACASSPVSRVGRLPFVPVTAELPLRTVTRWAVGAALIPFVVLEVWRAWLSGRDVAPWVYGAKAAEDA
ncbi:arylamine N-acetyltransferase [Tessaracoccus flavescens]|uniref:Transglutaminase-like domain-containing protein n=1 Tax=Tessaracoccus flavescens TaxID=399497 RepID=A0A1Q2CV02_9ACTN|nr:arylamine N-acetyltransferase [Tessaracoccus flavescens]AQP49917.1 hypothetical protein BW733_02780 [Tessaracoccus flavescens]